MKQARRDFIKTLVGATVAVAAPGLVSQAEGAPRPERWPAQPSALKKDAPELWKSKVLIGFHEDVLFEIVSIEECGSWDSKYYLRGLAVRKGAPRDAAYFILEVIGQSNSGYDLDAVLKEIRVQLTAYFRRKTEERSLST